MRPSARSCSAGEKSRYDTCTMSSPALLVKPAKMNCGRPGVAAQLSLPGSAFARAISWSIDVDVERGAHRDREERVGGRRDRHQVAVGVIGERLARRRIDGDRPADREQQRVLVARRHESRDRRPGRRVRDGSRPRPAGPSARRAAPRRAAPSRRWRCPAPSGRISRTVVRGQDWLRWACDAATADHRRAQRER